jgi:hypothetical protein
VTAAGIALAVLVAIGCVYWLAQAILVARVIRSVPVLAKLPIDGRAVWPRVSLIIPARNEEDTIEAAVASRLREDYPGLEIVIVEDRSTDRTPEIADRLAVGDGRVRVVHVTDLPDGWLGKLHALHLGTQAATGDWLLYSDADVHFAPGTIKRAVTHADARRFDLLAVLPELYPTHFFLDAGMSVFVRTICLAGRVWALEDPNSSAAVGSGSFSLVRREAMARTPGFEYLKMEVGDDISLGQMLKRSGARVSLVNGRGAVGVHFYRTLRDAAVGAERAGFTAIGNFRLSNLVAIAAVLLFLEMTPFVSLIFGHGLVAWIGGAMLPVAVATSAAAGRWLNRPLVPSLFYFVGSLLNAYILVRAGVLGKLRGGIYWRGTFYPTAALRAGRRFRF